MIFNRNCPKIGIRRPKLLESEFESLTIRFRQPNRLSLNKLRQDKNVIKKT